MAAAGLALMQLAQGFQASQILYTVTKFGVADLLKDGPKSGEEIATATKAHEGNFVRLLRAAAGLGIFHRDPETLKYSLNDVSKLLLDGPISFKWPVLHLCESQTVQAWSHLDKSVEDGSLAFKSVFGEECFDYYGKNAVCNDRFNKAMTALSLLWNVGAALNSAYSFKEAKHVVDVGGGQGAFLVDILRVNPHLKGTTFDLAHVVEDAKERRAKEYSDVQSRFNFAGGSFFDNVPAGGDIYTLKLVIHDWGDTKAIQILKNIHKVLPDNGKVLVLDRVIKETNDVAGGLLDIHMMVLLDAKERTEKEFHHVFNSAGLKINRFIPLLPTFFQVIEGEKI